MTCVSDSSQINTNNNNNMIFLVNVFKLETTQSSYARVPGSINRARV